MTATINCSNCKHGFADTALFCPNCGRPKARVAENDPLVGKLLGERFSVQAMLGQGGSGTIYRAEHVTLRRKVAIKVLHDELSRDDLAVERFRREATTVADIDNEHIVEIHDFGRTPDGRLYLAMEMLEGEALDAVLARETQLSVERTADILIQVGEALMEAHAIGYIHRDLRPRNIYLTQRRGKANFVKLLDFGLAKLVDSDTQAQSTSVGMTFGDPRYMSPEQARGDRIDRRADIYQLGCVAYEMLTGAPPFTGSRVFDILTKQVTEAPAPLPTKRPGVPLWMEAAVAKMLAKDPENRFATTSRMVEALRRGLQTGDVMDDEIARRRESQPPPSVSRVMQRMGITAPVDPQPLPPVVVKPVAPAAAPAPAPAPAAEAAAEQSLTRRSTGTPKVGVPIVKAPDPVSEPPAPPVVATPEPSWKARKPSVQAAAPSNLSSSWYEEGERASEEAAKSSRAKPSSFDADSDSMYDEPLPRPRRWGLIIGVLGFLIVGGTVAFALSSGSDDAKPTSTTPAPVATPVTTPIDAAPSTIIEPPDASVIAMPTPATQPTTTTAVKTKSGRGSTPTPEVAPSRPRGGGDVGSFVVPGGDATFRRPGGSSEPVTVTTPTPPPPVVTPIQPTTPPPTPGVSGADGPEDPYGNGGGTPTPTPTPTPYDDAAAGGDQKASFFANLGQQQLNGGDMGGAAANFKKALELDAQNLAATIGMGEIAMRQGLFGDAIAHFKKASRISRSARVFTLLGEAYLNSGNNSEAANNFKKALQIEPDNTRARDGYNEASSKVPPPEE
ncbi:MAG: protein kinase [Kofleriaceae bacterium]|nr:protein kinase [Kofleriaceae bacterium]